MSFLDVIAKRMYNIPPRPSENQNVYSWAGHCRFQVVDNSAFAEEEKYYNRDRASLKNEEEICPEKFGKKSKKVNETETGPFSNHQLHNLKPIKQTYAYVRNDAILKKLQIKRPKWTHLYSHPLKKISSTAARKLKSMKSMKLLSLRDYGYNTGESWQYYRDGEKLKTEDVLTYQELEYLLEGRTSLKKLYVMLRCEDWETFKRLQVYAQRQKNLIEFGFLSDFHVKKRIRLHTKPLKYDIRLLSSNLKKLEIRLDTKSLVEIQGIDRLSRLNSFNCGTSCGLFPCETRKFDFDNEDEYEDEWEGQYDDEDDDDDDDENFSYLQAGVKFSGPHGKLISQVCLNPGVQNICFKQFELGFDREFWTAAFISLRYRARNKANITYEILSDSGKRSRDVISSLKKEIRNSLFSVKIQLLIVDSGTLMENCKNGGGLRANNFNFAQQYLFEINNYQTKKILPDPDDDEDDCEMIGGGLFANNFNFAQQSLFGTNNYQTRKILPGPDDCKMIGGGLFANNFNFAQQSLFGTNNYQTRNILPDPDDEDEEDKEDEENEDDEDEEY